MSNINPHFKKHGREQPFAHLILSCSCIFSNLRSDFESSSSTHISIMMYDLLLYFYVIDIINAYIELMDSQTEYSRAFTLEELVDVARVYIVI